MNFEKPREAFERLRNKYRLFYEVVKEWHQKADRPHRGHGLDHDVTVAQICLWIAPDVETGEMAWIASFLHSVDRTVERGNKEAVSIKITEIMNLLNGLGGDRMAEIFNAAMRHSELNMENQSIIQQVLMDADRLANLMALVVIRAGQLLSDTPAIEFEHVEKPNPSSTYRTACSVMDDLRANLSLLGGTEVGYIEQLRLPKAIELGARYHAELMKIVEKIKEQHRDLGLDGILL